LNLLLLLIAIGSLIYFCRKGNRVFWVLLVFGTFAATAFAQLIGVATMEPQLFAVAGTLMVYLGILLAYIFDRKIKLVDNNVGNRTNADSERSEGNSARARENTS
jgi:protein-S-isoprenylcysteine O-methyltransferase Ste14